MINQSQLFGYVLSSNGTPVKSLSFVPSSDNSYIGVYAQYGNNPEWVPLNIGLPSVPGLQQARDMNRNISMNEGSYEDAHFYLRSAAGNNVTTAFYTNANGGAIQSGDTDSYTALNLQPLGGVLTYGGDEVATKTWTNAQGFLKTIAGTANRITVSGNTINIATNYAGQNTITTLGTVTTGTWNGSAVGIAYGGTGQTSIGTNGQTLRSNGTSWVMADALTYGGVIPASANLNNYQTTGIYIQGNNANAASGTNYPIQLAGKLEVVFFDGGGANQFIWQTYHQYQGSGDRSIYKREYYAGAWSAWVKILDANTATLQQVTTAGNSTTNNIALTGGTNGSSLLIDAVNSNYTVRAASSTGWARGLVAYNNAGTTMLNTIGFNGSNGTTFTNGYIGQAYNNAILKWTNSSVGIGFASTNLPTQNFHAILSSTTNQVISRFESFDGYVDIKNAGASGSVMTPMVFGFGKYQTAYGLMLRGSGNNGYTAAAVHISGTNATDNGAVTSGNILAVNNYTTNLLTLDSAGVLTMPNYGGLQGTSIVTTNVNGTLNKKVIRTSSVNNAGTPNMFGKIATMTISNQFNDANIVIDANLSGAGTGSQGNSKILIRAKQQAAFGNDPLIEMVQFNHNAVTPTSYYQFWYVIVQNTPTTIIDIYVKIIGTFITLESNIWDAINTATVQYYNQAALSASITGTGIPVQFTQYTYGTQEWVNSNSNIIKQNGNDFGSTNAMVIGTINNGQISFKANNLIVSAISTGGHFVGPGIYNGTAQNNASILTTSGGIRASRNIADNQNAFEIDNANTTSTGNIQAWRFGGISKAFMDKSGLLAGAGIVNYISPNNGYVYTTDNGIRILRNVADTNNAFEVDNYNPSNTGNIQRWKFNGVTQALIANTGDFVMAGNLQASGSLSIGVSAPATFFASATAFPSLMPKADILTGTTTGTYKEGIIIKHNTSDGTAVARETGLFIKLSYETSAGESSKGGAITMKSSAAFANNPDMNFYILNDASPKMTIYNNGTVGINNLTGIGTRVVTASSTGVLSTVASLPVSNGGTGTNALTGIIVGNGTSAMTAVTGTANQLLRRNAANTAYEFFTAPYLTAIPTLQQVATAGNSYTGDLLLGISGSELYVGSTTIGDGNTRLGRSTLNALTSGSWNTAIGSEALKNLTTGVNNTTVGEISLLDLVNGSNNTAIGDSAGIGVTGGDNNIYFGLAAGLVSGGNRARGNINIFIGRGAGKYETAGSTTLGSYNIALGLNAGQNKTDVSNQLFIGNYDPVLFPQHLIEGVMGTSQALTLNADVKISTLNGSGSRMVVADSNGVLSTQPIGSLVSQWIDNTGTLYGYLSANDPNIGGGRGIYSNGGYASNYQELITPYGSINDDVEFAYRIDPTNTDWTLYLPDPSLFPNRVLNITNFSTDTNAGIILDAYPPVNTETGINIDYLSSVKGDPSVPQWIQIMSINTTINSTSGFYWMVIKAGRKTGF